MKPSSTLVALASTPHASATTPNFSVKFFPPFVEFCDHIARSQLNTLAPYANAGIGLISA
jgi:hypothetical protein